MAIVNLESIGAVLDDEQGILFPVNPVDGTWDEECMTDVRMLDEELVAGLSPEDAIHYQAALARVSR